MNNDHLEAADALDRWWDEFQNGAPLSAIPEVDVRVIQEITMLASTVVTSVDKQRTWERTSSALTKRYPRGIGLVQNAGLVTGAIRILPRRTRISNIAAILAIVVAAALILSQIPRHQSAPGIIIAPQVATPEASPSADVPMYRGNPARTGEMVGPGPQSVPSQIWRFPEKSTATVNSSLSDGVMYSGTNDGLVHALDALTGHEIWTFDTSYPGRVVVEVGKFGVFASTVMNRLIALDKDSGAELWTFEGSRENTSPMPYDSVVYVDGNAGSTYVLDQTTGNVISEFAFPKELERSAAISNGIAVGPYLSTVYANDMASGSQLWTQTLDYKQVGTPAIVGDQVIVSAWSIMGKGSVYSLDITTGEITWKYTSPTEEQLSGPAVSDTTVFVGSTAGEVFAIDLETGALRWTYQLESGAQIISAPGVTDTTLFVGAQDGTILAIDTQTGSESWQTTVTDPIEFGPSVSGELLWVNTTPGEIVVLSAEQE